MKIIKSVKDLLKLEKEKPVILLYSGGLDSTYLLVYLKEELGLEVISLYVDVGQEEPFANYDIAESFSSKVIKHNAIDEFVKDYVYKAIVNQGLYLRRHPLSASLTRPLFSKCAYKYAKEFNSECIIHCATSTQNSLRRYNTSLMDLGFRGVFGSPFENTHISRKEKLAYLKEKAIVYPKERSFSFDTNLWCREFESGNLTNPENIEIDEKMFIWSKHNPNTSTKFISVNFENSVINQINNKKLSLREALVYLNKEVGEYGLGRYISLEQSPTSKKVLEVREAPAAMLLIESFWELASASLSQSTQSLKMQLDTLWATEASEGRWFGDTKIAIEAFNNSMTKNLSGSVTYKISNQGLTLFSVKSNKPKYHLDREEDENIDSFLKITAA